MRRLKDDDEDDRHAHRDGGFDLVADADEGADAIETGEQNVIDEGVAHESQQERHEVSVH
jgi:hypothetical protein